MFAKHIWIHFPVVEELTLQLCHDHFLRSDYASLPLPATDKVVFGIVGKKIGKVSLEIFGGFDEGRFLLDLVDKLSKHGEVRE